MSKTVRACWLLLLLVLCKIVALPTREDIFRVRNVNRTDLIFRTAEGCTGQKRGLYVPYNAVKFFWSGFGVADSDLVAAEIAQHVAERESKKGLTLEMILAMEENVHIKPCIWTTPVTPECRQFWEDISCEYASNVKGEIRVILGSRINPEGAWMKIEKNQLEYRRQNGQDLWGFKQYELNSIYCKDMASHQSNVPQIKNTIC